MPKRGKKVGKGKGKGKSRKKAADAEELLKTCKRFIKSYQAHCAATGSVASQRILRDLRTSVEKERPLPKFIIDLQAEPARKKAAETATRTVSKSPALTTSSPSSNPPSQLQSLAVASNTTESTITSASRPVLLLEPLVNVWRELNYHCLRCLHVWNLPQTDEAIVALALFVESPLGPNLKVLELRDAHLSAWALGRLARSLGNSQIAVLNLDYNRCVRLAVGALCAGLQRCDTLHSLSLNYCHLDASAGEPLGCLTAASPIKHLSLIGNNLHCEGASELVTALVKVIEGGRESLGPPLSRLHLQDNGIDVLGSKGMLDPIIFTRLLKRWILRSGIVEDINLDGNWIGDGAGRELVLGLQERKEIGLPSIRLTVTHRISSDIFASVIDLGTPGKKKKSKRKGKKKK